METVTLEREPVTLRTEAEVKAVGELQRLLQEAVTIPQLLTVDREAVPIPEPVFRALQQIVSVLAQGDSITLVPLHRELTTQEAADLLNISRPSLIKLLDDEFIPYSMVGTHRRLRLNDVLAYKRVRSQNRRLHLAAMTALAEECGEYD